MVDGDKIKAGEAVGLLPDGSINIGAPEQMKEKFDEAQAEAAAAEKDDLSDLGDVENVFDSDKLTDDDVK